MSDTDVDPNWAIEGYRDDKYPIFAWYALVTIIGAIGIVHWTKRISSWIGKSRSSSTSALTRTDTEAARPFAPPGFIGRSVASVTNVTRILLYRKTLSIRPGWSTNVAEAFAAIGYVVLFFGFAFAATTSLEGQVLFIDYWVDRTGTLATSQYPLMVVLGSKNNLLSIITGVSYQQLSYLHRLVCRVVLILILIHTFGYVKEGLTPEDVAQPYLIGGIIATVAFFVLTCFSVKPVREKAYEFFFFNHMFLGVLIMVGTYFHIRDVSVLYMYFVWPSFIAWAIDRLIRLARMIFVRINVKSNSKVATLSRVSPFVIRMDVPVSKFTSWAPGQHVFLTLPKVSNIPTEAHPFTIACLPSQDENRMTFFIKAKQGMTARLLKYVVDKGKESTKVIVDGPYGLAPEVWNAEVVMIIAGGTGCAFAFPMLEMAIKEQAKRPEVRIVFVWAIRYRDALTWITDSFLESIRSLTTSANCRLEIYVTSGSDREAFPEVSKSVGDEKQSDTGSNSDKEKDGSSIDGANLGRMIVFDGKRPDLPGIIGEELSCARRGNVKVYVSGPEELLNSVNDSLKDGSLGYEMGITAGVKVEMHLERYEFA